LGDGAIGELDGLFDGAEGIADVRDVDPLAGLSPQREDDARPGEGADVHAVEARAAAAKGAVAELDDVFAVFGGDDGDDRVLAKERAVVVGGEFEALLVEDGDVGVEGGFAQAHAFDLDVQALALFRFDDEVVLILVVDDAGDGDVEGNGLGRFEIAVGFLFFDDRERADPEGFQF
jgi:hypothetical protein